MTTRRTVITSLAALAGGLTLGPLEVSASPLLQDAGPRAGYFPNVLLRTHEGKEVRFYDDVIRKPIVAINMMYADCTGICPRMTANLVKVQRALGPRVGRDIFMYSITLRPAQDTPEVLHTYVRHHGVKPGWQFLTGRPSDIEVLRRRLGFYDPDPRLDRDMNNHTGVVRVGNEAIDSWVTCPALGTTEQIVESILWMDVRRDTDARG
jgi:protein SCO1/2